MSARFACLIYISRILRCVEKFHENTTPTHPLSHHCWAATFPSTIVPFADPLTAAAEKTRCFQGQSRAVAPPAGMGLMRELSNIGNNSERREGLLTSLENGWLDASFVHCCLLTPYQRPTTPPRARLDCWQQHHFSSWLLEILPEYVQH